MLKVIDARQVKNNRLFQTDICIIGAGAAGVSIAQQFVNMNFDVMLIESGGWTKDSVTDNLREGFLSSPFPHIRSEYVGRSRQRYFGGTTNIWTGWCRPLDPIDFEKREWVAESGWPIDYTEIWPCYAKAAEILKIEPYQYISSENHPLNASEKILSTDFHFSPPVKFGEGYLRQNLLNSKNVQIMLFANLYDIKGKSGQNAVDQIVTKTIEGNQFSIKAKYFVLATGGIENARLLLASESFHPKGLGNQNDLVGRYFMEHPHLKAGVGVFCQSEKDLEPYKKRNFSAVGKTRKKAWVINPENQREEKLLNFCLVPNHRKHNRIWNVNKLGIQVGEFSKLSRLLAGYKTSKQPLYMDLDIRFEQTPNFNSRIELSDEKDLLGMPRAKINYQLTEQDRQSMLENLNWFGREIGQHHLGRLNLFVSDEDPWPEKTFLAHHHMGSTRMSIDPKKGVVDANCKIHEVDNFYLAGSSVFPTSGHANPTMTIVALSLRLAEHLKTKMSKKL